MLKRRAKTSYPPGTRREGVRTRPTTVPLYGSAVPYWRVQPVSQSALTAWTPGHDSTARTPVACRMLPGAHRPTTIRSSVLPC